MSETDPRPGDPLYVPASEVPMALSLGAAMVEGDARLFIPSVLPDGVTLPTFGRWMTNQARLVWIGELLESIIGDSIDLLSVAGLVANTSSDTDEEVVPLYVPSDQMDYARGMKGVWWDRNRRMYVADKSADFGLIHRYLTPGMKAAWAADRNIETAMTALVRAQAIVSDNDDDEMDPRELGGLSREDEDET